VPSPSTSGGGAASSEESSTGIVHHWSSGGSHPPATAIPEALDLSGVLSERAGQAATSTWYQLEAVVLRGESSAVLVRAAPGLWKRLDSKARGAVPAASALRTLRQVLEQERGQAAPVLLLYTRAAGTVPLQGLSTAAPEAAPLAARARSGVVVPVGREVAAETRGASERARAAGPVLQSPPAGSPRSALINNGATAAPSVALAPPDKLADTVMSVLAAAGLISTTASGATACEAAHCLSDGPTSPHMGATGPPRSAWTGAAPAVAQRPALALGPPKGVHGGAHSPHQAPCSPQGSTQLSTPSSAAKARSAPWAMGPLPVLCNHLAGLYHPDTVAIQMDGECDGAGGSAHTGPRQRVQQLAAPA
jgi:hypothetical protein